VARWVRVSAAGWGSGTRGRDGSASGRGVGGRGRVSSGSPNSGMPLITPRRRFLGMCDERGDAGEGRNRRRERRSRASRAPRRRVSEYTRVRSRGAFEPRARASGIARRRDPRSTDVPGVVHLD
jgi:hypothetical protein